MVRCGRCCLYKSMRVTNLLVNLCGVAMIIYSLWLLKKWKLGISDLPTVLYIPKPWFIYACLGVGIAVCLSMLFGHMVANSTNGSILCIYIFSIFSVLLLQVAVIVTIFFRMDWNVQLSKYIDEDHTEFKSFVIFHVRLCRLIVLTALVPQINVIVLASILWGIGTEPRLSTRPTPSHFDIPDFRQSFLVPHNTTIPHENIISNSRQSYRNFLLTPPQYQYPRQSFPPFIFGLFRMSFPSRPRVIRMS